MKKQSAAGLFFSILLKAVVIILGLVIIGFGIFFIIKVAKTDKKNDAPATTVSDNVLTEVEAHDDLLYETATEATEESLPEEQEPAAGTSYNKNILVLNSTDVTGLAGRWCGKLNDYGYTYTSASDYSTPQETTRVIAKEEGVGEDLVQYFNEASYEVGTVTEGISVSTDGVDIVIILGTKDDDGQ